MVTTGTLRPDTLLLVTIPASLLEKAGFNRYQPRGPDGRWISYMVALRRMYEKVLATKSADSRVWIHGPLVSSAEAHRVKEDTGVDISGYRHLAYENDVWHSARRHGLGDEADPQQDPVGAEDIRLAQAVFQHPDHVEEAATWQTGARGLLYEKHIGTWYVEAQAILTGRKHLALQSLHKRKIGYRP